VTTVAWCCGAGLVIASIMTVSGLRHSIKAPFHSALFGSGMTRPADLPLRLILAAISAAILGIFTKWPMAAAGGAALGFFSKELVSPKLVRQAPIERTEAIAVWTEQLRDTMAAAAGLQQAIVATAPLSPELIRGEVTKAASLAARQPLVPALLQLATDLADPTADLVITALVLAASGEAQDLGEVLSTIATSARDDATMRRYVDASRARTRTAVRTITATALVTLVALLILGHGYLDPYSSASGQLVLAVVLICYGLGVAMLHRMGREKPIERILAPEGAWAQ
jgi:tight adherence protein B